MRYFWANRTVRITNLALSEFASNHHSRASAASAMNFGEYLA